MYGRLLLLTFAVAAFVSSAPVYAQAPESETDAAAPAHVSLVDGAVCSSAKTTRKHPHSMPLLSGDRLRTRERPRRSALRRWQHAASRHAIDLDIQSDEVVRLTRGAGAAEHLGIVLSPTASTPPRHRVESRSPANTASLVSGHESQMEVAVVRGSAEVVNGPGTRLRAGERAYAATAPRPHTRSLQLGNWDAFDGGRRHGVTTAGGVVAVSARRHAALLPGAGPGRRLALHTSYGYAWYPRVAPTGVLITTAAGRRTALGLDVDRRGPCAWPTHHYGRWGFSAGVWFWIPADAWAPAYVSWGYAPGYVSWCPLGFDNRPVIRDRLLRRPPATTPVARVDVVSVQSLRRPGYYVNSDAVAGSASIASRRPRFGRGADHRHAAVPRDVAPISRGNTRRAGAAGSIPPLNPAEASDRTGTGGLRETRGFAFGREEPPLERRRIAAGTRGQGAGFPPASRTPRDGAHTIRGSESQANRDQTLRDARCRRPFPAELSRVDAMHHGHYQRVRLAARHLGVARLHRSGVAPRPARRATASRQRRRRNDTIRSVRSSRGASRVRRLERLGPSRPRGSPRAGSRGMPGAAEGTSTPGVRAIRPLAGVARGGTASIRAPQLRRGISAGAAAVPEAGGSRGYQRSAQARGPKEQTSGPPPSQLPPSAAPSSAVRRRGRRRTRRTAPRGGAVVRAVSGRTRRWQTAGDPI